MGVMKTKKKSNKMLHADPKLAGSNDPMSALEESFGSEVEGVYPEMTHAASQEGRRMSRYSGKTIRRPREVVRSM